MAENILRAHAEHAYAEELEVLKKLDTRQRPPNWQMSPWAVVYFLILLPIFSNAQVSVNQIIGTWLYNGKNDEFYSTTFVFTNNGAFLEKIDLDSAWDKDSLRITGKYKISGDLLILQINESGKEEKYKIHKISKKQLSISFLDSKEVIILRRKIK